MVTLKVVLTLEEELLGTASANPDLYREFIESRRPEDAGDEDEAAALPPVDEVMQKGTTVFLRTEEGRPFLWDYQIKGFFKDACSALRRADDTASAGLKAYRKEIDGLVFVAPRRVAAELPGDAAVGICQRPLRAQTPQGERISLVRSETLPAGTVFRFEVRLLKGNLADLVLEWLDYGALRGLGQWRNSGKGRFRYVAE